MTDEELKKEIDSFVFREFSIDFSALYEDFVFELSIFYSQKGKIFNKQDPVIKEALSKFNSAQKSFKNKMKKKILSDLKE